MKKLAQSLIKNKTIAYGIMLCLIGGNAYAGNLVLRPAPILDGTEIKVGDIFANAGKNADKIIARTPRTRQKIIYSANALQSKLKSMGLSWNNNEKVTQVVIWDGNVKANSNVSPNLLPPANTPAKEDNNTEVAVLNRDVSRDTIITPDMIVWQNVNSAVAVSSFKNAEELIGKVSTHSIKANTPLKKADIATGKMVKRGENITLVYQYGAMRITASGKALSDGGKGDTVKVANTASNKIISAIVEDNGIAAVREGTIPTNSRAAPNLYGSAY